jgi:hypothetical protein
VCSREGTLEVFGADRCEHERARRSVMNQALPGRWQSSSRGRHRQASSDHRTVHRAHITEGQPAAGVTRCGGDDRRRSGDAAQRGRGKLGRGRAEHGQRRTLTFSHRKRWRGGVGGRFERPLVNPTTRHRRGAGAGWSVGGPTRQAPLRRGMVGGATARGQRLSRGSTAVDEGKSSKGAGSSAR